MTSCDNNPASCPDGTPAFLARLAAKADPLVDAQAGVAKHRAISVVFFAHSSQLEGAERSLIELIDELITDYGVVCTVVVPSEGPLVEAVARLGASIIR